jgi:hypothetical protein
MGAKRTGAELNAAFNSFFAFGTLTSITLFERTKGCEGPQRELGAFPIIKSRAKSFTPDLGFQSKISIAPLTSAVIETEIKVHTPPETLSNLPLRPSFLEFSYELGVPPPPEAHRMEDSI